MTILFCRFLFERTGTMYKRYRARITEIKNSLDVNNDSASVQGNYIYYVKNLPKNYVPGKGFLCDFTQS